MAYMSRLGLWGPGTAFTDFGAFLDTMKKRGVSFLELLAMEAKASGYYVARSLSFRCFASLSGAGHGCARSHAACCMHACAVLTIKAGRSWRQLSGAAGHGSQSFRLPRRSQPQLQVPF